MASQLCVLNHAPKYLTPYAVADFVNALDTVLRQYVARTWGFDAIPWVATSEKNLHETCMRLHLWERPEDARDAGAFGVHRTAGSAYTPIAHVFIESVLERKLSWTEIASHEVLEMVCNPRVNEYVMQAALLWAKEVCDPVMGTTFVVDGVKIANFVYPEFFIEGADGPFDHARVLKEPFSLAPTGYASITKFVNGAPVRRDIYGDFHEPDASNPGSPAPRGLPLVRHDRLRLVCASA